MKRVYLYERAVEDPNKHILFIDDIKDMWIGLKIWIFGPTDKIIKSLRKRK